MPDLTGYAPNSVLSGLQAQYSGSAQPRPDWVSEEVWNQALADANSYLQTGSTSQLTSGGIPVRGAWMTLEAAKQSGNPLDLATALAAARTPGANTSSSRVGRNIVNAGLIATGVGSALVNTGVLGGAAAAPGSATTYPLATTGGPISVTPVAGAGAGATAAGAAGTAAGATMPNWVNWANLGSTVLGLYGADRAADAQVAGSDAAIAESRRQYDTTRSDFQPAIKLLGESADALSRYNSGDTSGFFTSPEYQYNLEQTTKAGERALASMGLRQSGPAVKEAQRNASGLASRESSQFVNRLLAAAGLGTTGAATTASAGANSAASIGEASMNRGAARASGYANQFGALRGGLENYLLSKYLRAA